jgi:uncharacterized membrane protein YkvA (DUF1232 family)
VGEPSLFARLSAGVTIVKNQVKNAISRYHPVEIVRFVGHLPNFVRLFLRLLRDRRVIWSAKALLIGTIVYILSPFDILPDFWLVLGQMDDLALFAMACRMFIQLSPPEAIKEHVTEIDNTGKWTPF